MRGSTSPLGHAAPEVEQFQSLSLMDSLEREQHFMGSGSLCYFVSSHKLTLDLCVWNTTI